MVGLVYVALRTPLPPRGPLPRREADSPGHRRRGRLGSPRDSAMVPAVSPEASPGLGLL